MPSIPVFTILRTQLPDPVRGHGPKRQEKFLIRFKINNYTDALGTMDLLLYNATDHNHFGHGTQPIFITAGNEMEQVNSSSLVLGNLELKLQAYITQPPQPRYNFHHLKLIPAVINDLSDTQPHLCFIVKAFLQNGDEITVQNLTLNDANPSPPADPQ